MSNLYIPVGLPGCGKSTLAANLFPKAEVISTDAIREELTGDVNQQASNDQVFDLFHERIASWLNLGYDVYADATNLDKRARETVQKCAGFQSAPDHSTHAIVFDNVMQAFTRNKQRDRVVPDDVMVRFLYKFEKAVREVPNELFTSVTFVGAV